MSKNYLLLLMFPMLSLAGGVYAAGPMKAGLWEMTMKSDAMKDMPKLAPEQLEQMRKMGINIPQMGDQGMVMKVCISKEMAERDNPSQMHQGVAGCESKNYRRQGTGYSMDIVCDGPSVKGAGVAKGNFSSNEQFTSTYDFKGSAQDRPVNQHHDSSGKWLGANCGSVKPMDLPQ